MQHVVSTIEELVAREGVLSGHFGNTRLPIFRIGDGEDWMDPRLVGMLSEDVDLDAAKVQALSLLAELGPAIQSQEGHWVLQGGSLSYAPNTGVLVLHVQQPGDAVKFKPLCPTL